MRLAIFGRHIPASWDQRATAALEFAIVAPVLATFLAAAADYGLAMWSRSCLSNAVSQGAYYAFRQGTSVSPSNIVAVVSDAYAMSPPFSVAVSAVSASTTPSSGPACYCPSGTPAVLGSAVSSCTTACSDGSLPGSYIQIHGTYTLKGNFRLAGLAINGNTVSDTVTVRLK